MLFSANLLQNKTPSMSISALNSLNLFLCKNKLRLSVSKESACSNLHFHQQGSI